MERDIPRIVADRARHTGEAPRDVDVTCADEAGETAVEVGDVCLPMLTNFPRTPLGVGRWQIGCSCS